MRFSMFVTENAMQINLTPENDHESYFLKMIDDDRKIVTIHKGVDIGMCQGGYVRNFGTKSEALVITLKEDE